MHIHLYWALIDYIAMNLGIRRHKYVVSPVATDLQSNAQNCLYFKRIVFVNWQCNIDAYLGRSFVFAIIPNQHNELNTHQHCFVCLVFYIHIERQYIFYKTTF